MYYNLENDLSSQSFSWCFHTSQSMIIWWCCTCQTHLKEFWTYHNLSKNGVNLKCFLKEVGWQLVLFTYACNDSGMPLLSQSHTSDAITTNGICQYLLVPPLEQCCFFGASCLTQPHVLQLCNNFIIKWWWAYFRGCMGVFWGEGEITACTDPHCENHS